MSSKKKEAELSLKLDGKEAPLSLESLDVGPL